MADVNKAILIGHVGRDPHFREIGFTPMISFDLATSNRWKDKSGTPMETVEWHRVVYWGRIANYIRSHVRKGSRVYVEGKLTTRTFETNEGNVISFLQITGSRILLLTRKMNTAPKAMDEPDWPPVDRFPPDD